MTYTQCRNILHNLDSYTDKQRDAAVNKLYALANKMLNIMTALEAVKSIIGSVTRLSLWFGGTTVVLMSFLKLAYNATAEYTVPIADTLKLELLLIIGLVSAYIGYRLMEKERLRKNGRSK